MYFKKSFVIFFTVYIYRNIPKSKSLKPKKLGVQTVHRAKSHISDFLLYSLKLERRTLGLDNKLIIAVKLVFNFFTVD